jgi:hypothetical protein
MTGASSSLGFGQRAVRVHLALEALEELGPRPRCVCPPVHARVKAVGCEPGPETSSAGAQRHAGTTRRSHRSAALIMAAACAIQRYASRA